MNEDQKEALRLAGSCCFTCTHWIGKRRKDAAYCKRLNLSGKDATRGDGVCILWKRRVNARMPAITTCRTTAK